MKTRRNRPTQITDAPEHRSIPLDRVEMRAGEGDDNEIILEGYASTFAEYEMYGGPANWGWIERIDPNAFEVTLREKPDLHLLINHAGMPLARTKSGNLDLAADATGLKVTARLDKRDPEVQSLAVKMERGDMDEMSFAFRVKAQEWCAADGYEEIDDQSYRTITEVSLHKGDVSVVNWGANSTTSVGLRSVPEALKVIADADESEFAEVRDDDATLKRAIDKLAAGFAKPVVTTDESVEERSDEEDVTDGVTVKVTAEMDESLMEIFTTLTERLEALEGALCTAAKLVEEEDERADEEETEEKPEAAPTLTRLEAALAAQGILPEKLSLATALAFED